MTNQFTTPQFGNVLKQHGIEIDTQFCYYQECNGDGQLEGFDYLGLKSAIGIVDIQTGGIIENEKSFEISRAYLLPQVLGWLPKFYRTPIGSQCNREFKVTKNGVVLAGYSVWRSSNAKFYPIEQLIIQGLTEGWLTKEIIQQQIKQNQ